MKKSHSKVKTNDEFDCKGSLNYVIFCIRKPGEKSYESQSPLSVQPEKYDRTGQPVVCRDTCHEPGHHHQFVESTYSASYSGWDEDKAWPSQEWKADELMDDRTETPVVCPQREHTRFNHVSLVNTSTSLLKKKKITIERRNPLFALNEEQQLLRQLAFHQEYKKISQ